MKIEIQLIIALIIVIAMILSYKKTWLFVKNCKEDDSDVI
jgi:hypothetical protein